MIQRYLRGKFETILKCTQNVMIFGKHNAQRSTNKSSGGDGIPVELFQILKDDAVKAPHSICLQIWKTQQWPHRTGKGQFSFQSQTKTMPKNAQTTANCTHLTR